ncbi:MAG: cytochrome P450 [Chloroflexota bacterium]
MKQLSLTDLRHLMTDRLGFLERHHKQMGAILHFQALGTDMFVVSEPTLIRELLIKHGPQMQRDALSTLIFKRMTGDSVFTTEGEMWQRQRKMMQPAFHAQRIQSYAETMALYTREMLATWSKGKTVAIDKAFAELTLRIMAKTMLGVDLQSQVTKIGRHMNRLVSVAEQQLQAGYLPPVWLPTPMNMRHAWAKWRVRSLLRQLVRQRQAAGVDNGDLLSMILFARDEQGQPMSEKEAVDQLVSLFFAGQDTTSAALTWAWYLLLEYPEAAQRVQAEVGNKPLSLERVANLPYLEAVIKETLRLYPTATFITRMVVDPFTIGGRHFPKGALIIINIFEMHRRSELFCDPACFRPERFLDKVQPPERYAYMPFGAGARVCMGNMFARLEAQVILATMLQQVALERANHEPVVMDMQISLRPRDPLLVRVV